jgi:hypothetical protein
LLSSSASAPAVFPPFKPTTGILGTVDGSLQGRSAALSGLLSEIDQLLAYQELLEKGSTGSLIPPSTYRPDAPEAAEPAAVVQQQGLFGGTGWLNRVSSLALLAGATVVGLRGRLFRQGGPGRTAGAAPADAPDAADRQD